MPNSEQKLNHRLYSVFDIYIGISFLVQFSLWVLLSVIQKDFWQVNSFLTISVVGHYLMFVKGVGNSESIIQSKSHPWFYIFQSTMLIGCASLWGNLGAYFLAMIPMMASIYFFNQRDFNNLYAKVMYLAGPFIFGLTSGFFFLSKEKINGVDGLIILSFCLWLGSFISWANTFAMKKQKSFIYALLKRNKGKSLNHEKQGQRDRYFYHDIINHTHGVSLFLNSKVNSRQDVKFHEAEGLLHEIKMLQSLIKDHYGFRHKNLSNTYEFVTLDFAKDGIERMIYNYLPPHFVDCHILYQGMAGVSASPLERSECIVHYPSLFRILGNVVKNIAEAKSTQVEFNFNYTEKGLQVFIKNRLYRLQDDHLNLASNLSKIILEENSNLDQSHLGLESITQICEDLGGEFQFWHEGEFWVNQIFLPSFRNSKRQAA